MYSPQYLLKFRGSQVMALGKELLQALDGFLVDLRASRRRGLSGKQVLRIDSYSSQSPTSILKTEGGAHFRLTSPTSPGRSCVKAGGSPPGGPPQK